MFYRISGDCAILLLCLHLPVFAQVAVNHWTADNGLPINEVASVCRAEDGYLWLATLDGLVRFDGVRFVVFDRTNTEGIATNRFVAMSCTADGFWAGTEGGGVTRYSRGRFRTYTVHDGLLSNSIGGLCGDASGKLWVLAVGNVSRWDPAGKRFVTLDRQQYRYSNVLGADGRGVFYRIDESGLHLFANGEDSHYSLPAGLHAGPAILVGRDLRGQIWLAGGNGKALKLTEGRWSLASRDRRGLISDYRDALGKLWQTESGYDRTGHIVQYLSVPDSEQTPLAFTAFLEDGEGSFWLSTDGHGLYRVRRQTFHAISMEEGLPARNIYPIYETNDGAVWIGTWSGGLCRLKDGKLTTYTTGRGFDSNRVNAIGSGPDGALWAAVGSSLYKLTDGRFERVSPDRSCRAIHRDPRGVVWLGTGEGLVRIDHGKWTTLTRGNGLPTDDIRVIIDSRDGSLWAGGYGGLSHLGGGQVRAWTESNGLPSNTIRSLYEDRDGVLWIGSYDGGLGRFEKGRFTKYTVGDGLFNNGVFQILEDSHGNLWMSCNRGIYRVSKRQLNDFAAGKTSRITSISYGRPDGMRSVECNGGLSPAGVKTRDGRLWFPTQDGVAVIDPEKLPARPAPPPVVIESCVIDHTPVAIDRPVQIAPGHGNLEIQYTALSLINSDQIRFRYQLLGLDRDWVDAGTRRTAYFAHLPAGRHVFRVTAAHSDSGWNEAAAGLTIIVLPPFYQRWWFVSLLCAAAAGAIWLGWRQHAGKLERDRAAQQAFSRQLIDSQENERKRIAAELHDSLGQRLVVIRNRALLLLRNQNGASSLSESQREQVNEISTEVSEAVREVKEISYDLRPYRLDRLGLTVAVRAMIESASTASSINFSAEIDDIDGVFPPQAEINFYRIVQECLNNILKHSQAALASVRIRRTGGRIEMIVRDDGRGFAPTGPRGSLPAGFGLTGISERAQLLGGKAIIQSLPGQGTIVTIDIALEA